MLHQDFKRDFLAGAPREGITIPFEILDAWFQLRITDDLLSQCREWSADEAKCGERAR